MPTAKKALPQKLYISFSAHPFICTQERTANTVTYDIHCVVNRTKYGFEYGICYSKPVCQTEVLGELYRRRKDKNHCWKPWVLLRDKYPQEEINDSDNQYIPNIWSDKSVSDEQCNQHL